LKISSSFAINLKQISVVTLKIKLIPTLIQSFLAMVLTVKFRMISKVTKESFALFFISALLAILDVIIYVAHFIWLPFSYIAFT
jgi:hypothetical protein